MLSIFSGFGGMGSGIAHFAHLGGYAGAWVYMRTLDRARTAFKRRALATNAVVNDKINAWKAIDTSRIHEANRPEVERLIGKIRERGVNSLSPQERMFLSSFIPQEPSS
jgi:hypothetical protein